MSAITNSPVNALARHHTNTVRKTNSRKVNIFAACLLTLGLFVHSSTFAANSSQSIKPSKPAAAPVAKVTADPFAGDVWHAVTPSWPGTLKFDGKTKAVVLAPVGAPAINAKYTYTINQPAAGNTGVLAGTLRMTNAQGQVSESQFKIEKKTLALTFQAGQRPETYVKMTPAEEAAEMARLKRAMDSGKVAPIR